ncbi:MAG: peptidase S10, partial [Proteobacteria bacterium]|nr:peptidase S10 [Pseudomonadota bacterium]
MRKIVLSSMVALGCLALAPAWSADKAAADKHEDASVASAVKAQKVETSGSVSVEGKKLDYKAIAGTMLLTGKDEDKDDPTASMFYVAYFKSGVDSVRRPLTFLYNGGPGSSTVWLHMGAFGPKRVVTLDDQHTPAAPYQLIDNNYSLLDASDLVFIDAPGTGFSRVLVNEKDKAKRAAAMKERGKEFYGVDQDAQAFAQFITKFLTEYGRWNSPKYL